MPGTGRGSERRSQHRAEQLAVAPAGGFTYLRGEEEISSKLQYIVNLKEAATKYQSGNEFTWEFDGMHEITQESRPRAQRVPLQADDRRPAE